MDGSVRLVRVAQAREQRADILETELDAELLETEDVGERIQLS
jgi:hypothetical protein